jgi:ATP-dependent DNA helicase RecG
VPSVLPPEVAARQRLIDLARALQARPRAARRGGRRGAGRGRVARAPLARSSTSCSSCSSARAPADAAGREPGDGVSRLERLVAALRARLPFRPTGGAGARARGDRARPRPRRTRCAASSRATSGSGKTLVALLRGARPIEAGAQAAIMAPTELLAEQHFATVRPLAAPLGIRRCCSPAASRGAAPERARRHRRAARRVRVGTHALIQEGVASVGSGSRWSTSSTGFGVLQRAALQRQGDGGAVDVLVMSATPIPRTLA